MVQRTLVFTDIVDSTTIVQRLGDSRAAELWARHDRLAHELLSRHSGLEIDHTDGCFALFEGTSEAVSFAIGYHAAMSTLGLEARVGLHVGDVTLRRNPPDSLALGAKPVDVDGLAKPLAARVMSLAAGGQTLLSEPAAAAARDVLPAGLRMQAHGHYRLKGIDEPLSIHEIAGQQGAFVAPPDAEKAHRVVRDGDLWKPAREIRHNLPHEPDAFIGRSVELGAMARRLQSGARWLTLLGTGGTGKTRLACRYARSRLGDWPGGAYFCDLSESRSIEGICFTVGSSLEVPQGRDDPVAQLGHAIAGRGRCLVILDNFEQVAPHAAVTLGQWLRRAPDATFIVTSRELLHLPGEEVFEVEPLRIDTEGVDLFVARARSRMPDFGVSGAERAEVREVVALLDGLPLAIELAAARVAVLSPSQIRLRLKDRFGLLAGVRGAAARQQTLRAAIDWSWGLLAPWEQSALAQCAVFEGGFTVAAAEAVVVVDDWPQAPPVLDIVQSLVDKSLVRRWRPPSRHDLDEPHFGMYLSLHDYATDRLAAEGAARLDAAMDRHGRYYAGFGSDLQIDALSTHGGVARRHALALETDNLLAACRRAASRCDGETAAHALVAAWQVLQLRGPFAVAVGLADRLAGARPLSPSTRMRLRIVHADALRSLGRSGEAQQRLQAAIDDALVTGDRRAQATIRLRLGILASEGGDNDRARLLCRQACDLGAELGDLLLVARARRELGIIAYDGGHMDEAREHYDASLALRRDLGDRRGEADVLNNLGVHHAAQGRIDEAFESFRQALQIHREIGDRRSEGQVLGNLGSAAIERGTYEDAAAFFDQALVIHREVGSRRHEGIALGNLSHARYEQGRHDEAYEHVQAALAIHIEVGNRRSEAIALHQAAAIHAERGRPAEAQDCIERALAIARETGSRGIEGWLLRIHGDQLLARGEPEAARAAWHEAHEVLTEVGDLIELAKLRCSIGHLHLSSGEPAQAHRALDEAQAIAAKAHLADASEVGRLIARLRGEIEAGRGGVADTPPTPG